MNHSAPAPEPRNTLASDLGPRFDIGQLLYVWLTAVFVTALVMANVLGVKLFRFELPLGSATIPVEHTVGMLAFPITFLLTDLLNEYYGKRAARRTTYVAFTMAFLAFLLIGVARGVPIKEGIPGTANATSFENIFGSASLMYLASLVAFLLGSLLDIAIFGMFKRLTKGKLVWLRATGSTVISQLFDSFIITFVFFQGFPILLGKEPAGLDFVFATALTGYVLKFVISVFLTPVIYAGRWAVARFFGLRPIPASAA